MANGNMKQTGLTNDPPIGLVSNLWNDKTDLQNKFNAGEYIPGLRSKLFGSAALGGEADREKIAILNENAARRNKSVKPEAEFLNMAGVSEMFGVSMPDIEREIANNPKYDQSKRNEIMLGNSANYSEYYKSQIPEAEKIYQSGRQQRIFYPKCG